jgi:hypothetical protein
MELEQKLSKRHGKNLKNKMRDDKESSTCFTPKGRSNEIAAKQFGFNSKETYLRAKKVVNSYHISLINMMDEGVITIFHAAQVAELAPHIVKELVSKGADEIISFLRKRKNRLSENRAEQNPIGFLTSSISEILQNEILLKAECEHKLPLSHTLMHMVSWCDTEGKFIWDTAKAQTLILPYAYVDFPKTLTVLNKIGFIEKSDNNTWHIPLINKLVMGATHAKVAS